MKTSYCSPYKPLNGKGDRMSYHYKKVLYITVMYSDQLHDSAKETRWLIQIESEFPTAAKRVISIQRIEVRKWRQEIVERKGKTE